MKADKLFEELGYEKIIENDRKIIYRDKKFEEEIEIDLKYKMIFCLFGTDIEELQAINKKCEELGWI